VVVGASVVDVVDVVVEEVVVVGSDVVVGAPEVVVEMASGSATGVAHPTSTARARGTIERRRVIEGQPKPGRW
jgi:hypothetical protein